ncbi:unnamed protein product [Coffea canephora]|uniref:ABC transporter domain-containing protein n=1 Tax=Coffea canephora TaxID=49390 RepID=A0A068UHL4_COFCA|nr:unnamed protein product [Coffea canephora]
MLAILSSCISSIPFNYTSSRNHPPKCDHKLFSSAAYQSLKPNASALEQKSCTLFEKAYRPVALKFVDVVYKIKVKNEGWFKKNIERSEKTILRGVSGLAMPGEMLAMLGPSGSGKTTLLTALGGQLGGSLTGSITYNGQSFSHVMKRNTGFVTQDDILYPHLTVNETLVFTALLRLPNSLTKEENVMLAEAVITQLGLTECKNSIIGSRLVRGVSGGECKRVSIGQEMLINPSLLLLDEPTSGLDSTNAQKIVSTLGELANGGRTIVMTIHQPSSRLFYLFHKVLVLSEGNPIYYGKSVDAMDYFSDVGFIPKVSVNPVDFLLDLANDDSQDDQVSIKQTLVSAYKAKLTENLQIELKQTTDNLHSISEGKLYKEWTTTWWQQFSVLLRRGMKERKHETFSGIRIFQILVVSILCGLLWWQSNTQHFQDQARLFTLIILIGLLFFYTVFWGWISASQAIFTFPQEHLMLEKERASGMYRLSSYFMAMAIGDLPMELVLPSVFITITYWMAALKATAASFLDCWLVLLYAVLVAQGLGLAVGALVVDQKNAMILGSVIMLSFILSGGFYVNQVPGFIAWIKYVSIGHHAFKLLVMTCFVEDLPPIKSIGLDGLFSSAIAMAIMLVGYRLVAYIALMRVGVKK